MFLSLRQETQNAFNGGAFTVFFQPFPVAVQSGSLIHVVVTVNGDPGAAVSSVTDNQGNLYTVLPRGTLNTRASHYYGFTSTSGTLNVAANFSSSQSYPGIFLREILGANSANPVSNSNGAAFTASGSGNFTAFNVADLTGYTFNSAFSQDTGIASYCTPGPGWTGGLNSSNAAFGSMTEYFINNIANTLPFQYNATSATTYYCLGAAFNGIIPPVKFYSNGDVATIGKDVIPLLATPNAIFRICSNGHLQANSFVLANQGTVRMYGSNGTFAYGVANNLTVKVRSYNFASGNTITLTPNLNGMLIGVDAGFPGSATVFPIMGDSVGTMTFISNTQDTFGDSYSAYYQNNTTDTSQTISITNAGTVPFTYNAFSLYELSNANASNLVASWNPTLSTGGTTLSGPATVVPVNGVLLWAVWDAVNSTTYTNPGDGSTTLKNSTVEYVAYYTGTGASITPKVTITATSDTFVCSTITVGPHK